MTITIRPAEDADVAAVRALEHAWAASDETIGLEATPTEVLAGRIGRCFFVAAYDGRIVGFVFGSPKRNDGTYSAVFEDDSAYLDIEGLYVVPEQRCTGIGRRLVTAAVEWAASAGIRYLSVYSSTRDIDRVLRFYRACGFDGWSVQLFRDLVADGITYGERPVSKGRREPTLDGYPGGPEVS